MIIYTVHIQWTHMCVYLYLENFFKKYECQFINIFKLKCEIVVDYALYSVCILHAERIANSKLQHLQK